MTQAIDPTPTMLSPMTGHSAGFLARRQVLGKYNADYYFDQSIGSIFVSRPHWLEEAYSSALSITDTGGLTRNSQNVEIVSQRLGQCPHSFKSGVDLGGGYGLFVRGMRDAGWNFYWTDRYASNLVARGFEATPGVHEVVTAFEVLEHLENPLKFLQEAQQAYHFETCFFSATCFDELKLPGDDWWYWSTETGQHISFFSLRTLNWMAGQLNMSLHHIEGEIYCFSRHDWARSFHMWQAQHAKKMGKALESLLRVGLKTKPKPLTWSDYLTTRAALRTPGRAGQEP